MDILKVSQSKKIKIIITTIVGLAILSGVFQAGVFVGFHKAAFLFKSGDNFYRAFGDRDDRLIKGMGMAGGMFRDELSGGHGAIGKIVKVNLPIITVIGPDNIEKTIIVNDDTNIHQQRGTSSIDVLTADQYISVLGTPNDQGQIVAKFIRIVPPPPQIQIATTTINTESASSTNHKPPCCKPTILPIPNTNTK